MKFKMIACSVFVAFSVIAAGLQLAAAEKRPLKVVFAHGPGKAELSRLAEFLTANYNVTCRFVHADKAKKVPDSDSYVATPFDGIEALQDCDVVVSNLYRTWAPPDQLELLKQSFLNKPVVGLRKAHHGFQNWLEADREVFGVTYRGHYGFSKNGEIELLEPFREHPFFNDMEVTLPGGGCYAHRDPEPDLQVYMVGGEKEKQPHPQTWSRIVKQRRGQRVFYTRYDPGDIDKNPGVRRMVVHAIFWAAGRDLTK